ncbi:MAG: hypothetical protein WAJ93_00830, partial [Candidatus Nitrosopolaris sp.]
MYICSNSISNTVTRLGACLRLSTKNFFFAAEFRIEPRLVYPCRFFEIFDLRISKPAFPKHRDGFGQHIFPAKISASYLSVAIAAE